MVPLMRKQLSKGRKYMEGCNFTHWMMVPWWRHGLRVFRILDPDFLHSIFMNWVTVPERIFLTLGHIMDRGWWTIRTMQEIFRRY